MLTCTEDKLTNKDGRNEQKRMLNDEVQHEGNRGVTYSTQYQYEL